MPDTVSRNGLVDIETVYVDKTMTRDARIREFVRQIKDPYHFICGEYSVTLVYSKNGMKLEDCLRQIIGLYAGRQS